MVEHLLSTKTLGVAAVVVAGLTSMGEDPPGIHLRVPEGAAFTGVTEGSTSFGDVDHDGDLDLVVAGRSGDGSPTASLYLNDGSGAFTPANAGLTGVQFGTSSSFGDVDGDGNLDLVITGDAGNRNQPEPSATLYLGDGSGGFSRADVGLTGVRYGSSSLGDLNGDGSLDLVIAGQTGASGAATKVYLGAGDGSFSEAGGDLPGVSHGSVELGDVDGDGNLDLLLTGATRSGPMAAIYLGDGQGGFSESSTEITRVRESSSAMGDLNGDENPDLVVTGRNDRYQPSTSIYLGDGDGSFHRIDVDLTGVRLGSTSLGDVDGDGYLDLLVTGMTQRRQAVATLYAGTEGGRFSEADAGLEGVARSSSAFGDVDGDGDLDVVITGSPGGPLLTLLYLNDGSRGFSRVGG